MKCKNIMKKLLIISLLCFTSSAMAELTSLCKSYFEQVENKINSLPAKTAPEEQKVQMLQALTDVKNKTAQLSNDDQNQGCKMALDDLRNNN